MNFRVLSSPSSPRFEEELQSAPDVLTRDESSDFFDTVMHLFKRQITDQQGNLILQTIQKVIKNSHHLKVFTQPKYLSQLPFSEEAFCEETLNIVYLLVDDAPRCLTSQVVDSFVPCIDMNPPKCLVLIAKYALHFPEIDNPWPFLDLLFKFSRNFTTPDLIRDYCTILCFLCHKFTLYHEGRLEHCWTQMTACLSSEDIETIRTCYDALSSLAKLDARNLSADFVYIYKHLRSPATAQHALSLLISMQLPETVQKDPALLQSLTVASQFTEKGTVALAQMLSKKGIAELFMASTKWMAMQMPKLIDTLRIFLVVFKHRELRPLLAEAPELVPFLKLLVEQGNVGILSIVGTIIRKLEPDKALVRTMSKKGLLDVFFRVAWKVNDDISFDAAFHLAAYLSQITYVQELDDVARHVAEHATAKGRIARTACFAAAELAPHESCYRIMANGGLEEFFERISSRSELSRTATRFLSNRRPSSGRKSGRI